MLGALATGCSDSSDASGALSRALPVTTTVPPTTTEAPTTTTEPAPTTTTLPLPGFGYGASGPEVLALEQRLDALRYDAGNIDGRYDSATVSAVTAFQKVMGMSRTGRATDDVVATLQTATSPGPIVPNGGPLRVEIDLPRQVLFLYRDDALLKILPVSTGHNGRFCSEGYCRRAVTPPGAFRIGRRARGWETAPLGRLYNPLYFNGGIAIHGSSSVPARPASHGCVRITIGQAEWLPSILPRGTPVYVSDGKTSLAPAVEEPTSVPQPLPDGGQPPVTDTLPPPQPTTTTTTTAPVLFPPTTTTTVF